MKKSLIFILLVTLIFSCSKNNRKQFEYSGGSLSMALENEPTTFIPRNVLDYYSATILSQLSEGLVGMDPKTIKIIPKLASSWSKSDNGKVYTFTIRTDVKFHPHKAFKTEKDRIMTTEDIIHSFQLACSPEENGETPASYSFVFRSLLKGADDYFQKKAKTISGLTVDGNTVSLELLHEDHNFLNKLANVSAFISSKKVYDAGLETDKIGTGPFLYSKYQAGEQPFFVLLKNPDYYGEDEEGNALPYLDSVIFKVQSRKLEQLDMFETGELNFILGLPTSRITRMLEGRIQDFNSKPPKLILENNPLLESNFYYFNMQDERFKNPLVRKAFNYAVDKEAIGREILRNQYYDLGEYGIIPPISKDLRGYNFKNVKSVSYSYNPELARQLLAEAGYPNGEGFGSVVLRYNIDDTHSSVADEFSRQIFKTLGINVNIDGSTFEQLSTDGANANGDIFRMGWAADYPSPESFLINFYGKIVPADSTEISPINSSRYKNYLFDQFFDQAINSKKLSDQMKAFSLAEAELMKDPPIIPLWYTGDIDIIYSNVRGFTFNAINSFDFRTTYIKDWTAEEYKQKHSLNEK